MQKQISTPETITNKKLFQLTERPNRPNDHPSSNHKNVKEKRKKIGKEITHKQYFLFVVVLHNNGCSNMRVKV